MDEVPASDCYACQAPQGVIQHWSGRRENGPIGPARKWLPNGWCPVCGVDDSPHTLSVFNRQAEDRYLRSIGCDV